MGQPPIPHQIWSILKMGIHFSMLLFQFLNPSSISQALAAPIYQVNLCPKKHTRYWSCKLWKNAKRVTAKQTSCLWKLMAPPVTGARAAPAFRRLHRQMSAQLPTQRQSSSNRVQMHPKNAAVKKLHNPHLWHCNLHAATLCIFRVL